MKHIVVDLEMNPVKKKDPARVICLNEIIEIGAVMLDENYAEVSCFRTYVKPKHNSCIMFNIVRLTGINDDMVANAPTFETAFKMFTTWCLGTGDDIAIYAWSDSDFLQISKEMILKNYVPSEEEQCITANPWNDFQKMFDEHLGFEKQIALSSALNMAGIEFSGRAHDALDDARNTAELLQVFSDPELFENTLEKIREVMTVVPLETTLGSMFDFSQFAV